jgi:hypothetical protein
LLRSQLLVSRRLFQGLSLLPGRFFNEMRGQGLVLGLVLLGLVDEGLQVEMEDFGDRQRF